MIKEDQTIRIGKDKHVGWFKGSINGKVRRNYIAISEYRNDPMMGDWMTVSEAEMLRNALTTIIDQLRADIEPEEKT